MDRDIPVLLVGDDDPVTTGALDGLDLAVTPVDVERRGAELVCETWGLVVVVVVVVVVPMLDGTGVLTVDDTGDNVEVLRVVSAPVVVVVGVVITQLPATTSEAKQQQSPQCRATN